MDQTILVSAITYANQGLPVIACCDVNHKCTVDMEKHLKMCRCPGKAPIIKWRDKTETSSQEVIGWKNQFGDFNIGLPMGSVAGYIGIDIDGPGGEKLFIQMCGLNTLPPTWKFTTGDGYRLLFQIPAGVKTKKYCLTDPDNKHSECAILCEGQFSVIPPSIHHSGKRYAWVANLSPDTMDCAMAPTWLLDLVRDERNDIAKRVDKKLEQFTLNLEQDKKPAFAEKMADFAAVEFSMDIPEELLNATFVRPKSSGGKADASEEPKRSWQEMLVGNVISEGGRDNAMLTFIGSLLSEDMIRRGGVDIARVYIDRFNQEKLDPPLEQEALDIKITTIWEKEENKSAQYAQQLNEKRQFVPLEVVEEILPILANRGLTYIFDIKLGKSYYFKDGRGPWEEDCRDQKLHNIIYEYMISIGRKDWARTSNVKEIVSLMATLDASTDSSKALFVDNQEDLTLRQYLPVDGSLLDWQTGEMQQWSKEYHSLANFEVGYDPTARCPHWEAYLKQWLPEKDQRTFLQEFLGGAMLPLPDPEARFVILVGSGANGKSMCLDSIENLFGPTMSASQELGRLTKDQFGTAKLYGKRLNICSELTEADGYIKDSSIMKRLVSGETINIEYKGQNGFEYKPIASHIFSSNHIPRVRDKSDGWFRRQVIIPFEQKFEAREDISSLMKRNIVAERAGIFNWLIEGIRRKAARGKYAIPGSLSELQRNVRLEQDPILQFVTTFLRVGDGITSRTDAKNFMGAKYSKTVHGVSSAILHGLYKGWYCNNISDKSTGGVAMKSFQQYFKDHYGTIIQTQSNSVGRAKQTSVMLAVDFTYNDEMYDHIEQILESNTVGFLDGNVLDALQCLQRYHKMWKEDNLITV